jgi:hypothetical protein
MKLSNVAKYFNQTPVYDAYSGDFLFDAQLDVYDDSKSDGLTVQRRVLEVTPEDARPTRSVVEIGSQKFVLGAEVLDYFMRKPIRKKYVMHQADGLATVKTLRQLLDEAVGQQIYAGRMWERTAAQIEESSNLVNVLDVFFAMTETVLPNQFIHLAGSWHIVRASVPSGAGLGMAIVEQIGDSPIETGTITRKTHDKVTDTYQNVSVPVTVARFRWQSNFEYFSEASETFVRGDQRAAALKSFGLTPGQLLSLSDGKWLIVSTAPGPSETTLLHLRRA